MELQLRTVAEHPDAVIDEHQTGYRLAELLGEGGQGAVFRSAEHGAAIKLIYQDDPHAAASLQMRLDQMRSRPLWNWPISRPFAVLQPGGQGSNSYNGYVMDLRDGAVPISRLIGSEIEWDDVSKLIHWYNVTTGGLRRRLVLLAAAAETLAWLRSIPFVYADPSPNNILVSKNLNEEEVWLIDPDNIGLHRRSSNEPGIGTQKALTVYTPGYAAPEIVSGRSFASTLSDAFSFAVIAYEVLTLRHPYIGDVIEEGPPELVAEAYAGKWPWIEHPTDQRNVCEQGLRPSSLMLNAGLRALARQAFEEGRDDPTARPGMGRWADQLRRAADMTLPCRQCGATFYPFTGEPQPRAACRWCGVSRDGFALMRVESWVGPFEPAPGLPPWPGGMVSGQASHGFGVVPPGGLRITRRHVFPGAIRHRHQPLLDVRYISDGLELIPQRGETGLEASDLWLDLQEGERHGVRGTTRVRWRRTDQGKTIGPLHFGLPDRSHRVVLFSDFPGL